MWYNILLHAWCCGRCNLPIAKHFPKPCTCVDEAVKTIDTVQNALLTLKLGEGSPH